MKNPIMFYIIKQKEWVKRYTVRGDIVKSRSNNSLWITILNRYEKDLDFWQIRETWNFLEILINVYPFRFI